MIKVELKYTSGNWVCPQSVYSVKVECWGGGGAGAGTSTTSGYYGGGGGGAYAAGNVPVTPGQTYNFTISGTTAGGTTGTGQNGGDTYFIDAITVMAKGGIGGRLKAGGSGGDSSASYGNIVKYSGGNGYATNRLAGGGGGGAGSTGVGGNSTSATGGLGTSENGGNGGNAPSANTVGNPGLVYGGGGSGIRRTTGSVAGGSGAAGLIRITYEVKNKFIIFFNK